MVQHNACTNKLIGASKFVTETATCNPASHIRPSLGSGEEGVENEEYTLQNNSRTNASKLGYVAGNTTPRRMVEFNEPLSIKFFSEVPCRVHRDE